MVATETPREHIANCLQILQHLRPFRVPVGFFLSDHEMEALRRRLNAALTLLDQQESK